jgi:hypothetical protein
MMAKEDSLLLPPELLHDPERLCDKTRRHVAVPRTAIKISCYYLLVSFLRGRYKRDGSDVLGLMHFDQRLGYLFSQVQRRVMPIAKSSVFVPPEPLTSPDTCDQVDICRKFYQPYFLKSIMPRQQGLWPGFYCASMVTCDE